jgi:ubiquinone/menaquinone biosynthesis C-methylase UbiE
MTTTDSEIQRHYYAETAAAYDAMHLHEEEHHVALSVMVGLLDHLQISSILDVGSGTGRILRYLKRARPDVVVRGIEPVAELRQVAYANGIDPLELTDGDALSLAIPDGGYDLVCAFGVLHHIRTPDVAVHEMLRVSRRAVFISDANNFGQGSLLWRSFKQGLHTLGLWPLANAIKTGGRGYSVTEGDGLAYSYSIFDDYPRIRRACRHVHLFNTVPAGPNLYRTAGHVALVGVK